MAEQIVTIGGRDYDVACQDGEEPFLQAAAGLLDAETQTLTNQIGRMPEARVLLMAGLLLADKTAGITGELTAATSRIAELEAELEAQRSALPPEPERVEIPVIPESVLKDLNDLASRSEALADRVEAKSRSG